MKLWRSLLGVMLLLACVSGNPARAAQSSVCMPLSGLYSGVAYTQLINAAFAAVLSNNAGASAPNNDCGTAPVAGQLWYDTSTSTPHWRLWDGGSWLNAGGIDPNNHVWEPPIGGGLAVLPSAATTDLCTSPASTFSISGQTTITSFGGTGCVAGQIKVISFSGGLTLTNSSSAIILPTGGANITTRPNDQAVLSYTGGGIWRVIAYTRADGTPLTQVTIPPIHYAGEVLLMRTMSCPSPTLLEDGSAISRTTYPQLYAALGSTWGAGDGSTTFNLPYSGGLFDRGFVPGQTSFDQGRVFGSLQQDALQQHEHNFPQFTWSTYYGTAASGGQPFVMNGANQAGTTADVNGQDNARTASETRPANIPVYHCIFTQNVP